MFLRILTLTVFALTIVGGASFVNAQAEELPDASMRTPGRPRREEAPQGLREMLAKQRTEREKREYQELLDRGDEALRITKQLEASYEQHGGFSQEDRIRLESLERTVAKIRKELGAEDDADNFKDQSAPAPAEEPKPSNMEEAFTYLKSSTVKLVDELKKTTRFSVSVVAIQSSNTIMKLVRFLRIRK
jgi:hypothetical protein